MRTETLAEEARKCRNLAPRYEGRPEQRLLLNVAAAFDELAREGKSKRWLGSVRNESDADLSG
jgi:hypothetical protein